jgi:hypothetical protein
MQQLQMENKLRKQASKQASLIAKRNARAT